MASVKINRQRLNYLLDLEEKMQLLEGAGVDNWEGYDIAMEQYEEKKEILGKVDDLIENIKEVLSGHIETDLAGPNTGHGFSDNDEVEELMVTWLKENTTIFKN
jgi:hypothetical protein